MKLETASNDDDDSSGDDDSLGGEHLFKPQPIDKSTHKGSENDGSGGVDLNTSFQDVSKLEKSAANLENWLENMVSDDYFSTQLNLLMCKLFSLIIIIFYYIFLSVCVDSYGRKVR